MSAVPPAAGQNPSQRTLAAIVFTDVVSFSARMHADEVGTLKLLQRDFAEMRRICTEHEGVVLKTTGDGLLLTFTSAVQAVACTLAMQRQFAAEARSLAAGEALQHRIGVHLGDVLVQDEDVMGDGVNIAARLQAEAEPGGICISQTVYDVVRNKLQMKVVSLGPRDLKNIAQAMPVYRLLLEAQALEPSASTNLKPASPSRRKVFLAAGVAAVVAAIVATAVILVRSPRKIEPVAASAGASVVPANPAPATIAPAAAPDVGEGDLASDLAGEYAKRKDVRQELHSLYLDKYDFKGLVVALRDKAEAPGASPGLQQLLRSAEQLVRLREWLELTLRRYNRERPLRVHDAAGAGATESSVYLAPDMRVVVMENGSPEPREWAELKPALVGAIIVSALHEAKVTQRGIVLGAQAFARLYTLPAMTDALASEKVRHEKAGPAK
jgi:class 3 adenylate cyclase